MSALESPLAVAAALASRILKSAIRGRRGGVTWVGPHNPRATDPIQLRPIGSQLYGGTTGVALFLAALHSLDRDETGRDFVLEVLAPTRQKLELARQDRERAAGLRLGVGGFHGLGSVAYAFARIGIWIEAPDLLDEALDLVRLFTPERIVRDDALDVVSGSAGAILALLTVDELTTFRQNSGSSLPAEAAVVCGDHLLAQRVLVDRHRVWTTLPGKPPLASFAHGIAGIAHALLRLALRTGEARFREAAEEAVRFENTYYVAERRNWRDARAAAPRFPYSWCYGAPGIALGRVASWPASELAVFREDALAGLQETGDAPLDRLDHLCCGNMGRADILLFGGVKGDSAALIAKARDLAEACLLRRQVAGDFRWALPEGVLFDPSLLTGAAGVGYAFLRLVHPTTLPCVLALE